MPIANDCPHANEERKERENQEAVIVCMGCGRERALRSIHESEKDLPQNRGEK